MKCNELLEPIWSVASSRKPWPLNLSSLQSVRWPGQGHVKFRYEFSSIHHVNQKLVPEAHYSRNRTLIFNLNLFLSSLHIFCVSPAVYVILLPPRWFSFHLTPSYFIFLHLPSFLHSVKKSLVIPFHITAFILVKWASHTLCCLWSQSFSFSCSC